jgi:hypothetical protein
LSLEFFPQYEQIARCRHKLPVEEPGARYVAPIFDQLLDKLRGWT